MFRLTSTFYRQVILTIINFAARNKTGQLMLAALVVCSLYFAPAPAAGQDVRNPQSSVSNRERTELHVDPVTHALQFQISLGQYPGRAGANLPITLNYSSRLWNVKSL